jgi:CheY-like chemotaxis protein
MTNVLVIDDQATFRRAITRLLRRSGLVVLEAADGESGLAVAVAQPAIALVMVDCKMPGISGFEVITSLRRDRRFDRTKIVMVTGLEDDVAAELAIVAGADGCLTKPFTEAALIAQLDRVGVHRQVA